MNTMGQRLKLLRTMDKLSQQEFATKYNVSQRLISKYETDQLGVPDELKIKLLQNGVNIAWFLSGDGDIFVKKPSFRPSRAKIRSTSIADIAPLGELVSIRLGTQNAAGEALPCDDNGYMDIPASLLGGHKPEGFFAIPVNGDSMAPHIPHGSLAIIREQKAWFGLNGHVAAVMLDDGITLKLVRENAEKRQCILQPYNPDYEPIIIGPDDITEVRICGILYATVRYWQKP